MADVSGTRNLDAFQSKFERVKDAGHEVEAKLNRRGEAFLVKGRGKSKTSKIWFAIKHPHVYKRDNKDKYVGPRNVSKALKTAAKMDFGPIGPRLVNKFFKERGWRLHKPMTKGQVKEFVSTMKKDGASLKKKEEALVKEETALKKKRTAYSESYKGTVLKKFGENPPMSVRDLMKDTVSRNFLEGYLRFENNVENLYFLEDGNSVMSILKGDADADVRAAAFRLFVDRYCPKGSPFFTNLKHDDNTAFMKALNDPNVTDQDRIKLIKKVSRNIERLMNDDVIGRIQGALVKKKIPLDETLQPLDKKRNHLLKTIHKTVKNKWGVRRSQKTQVKLDPISLAMARRDAGNRPPVRNVRRKPVKIKAMKKEAPKKAPRKAPVMAKPKLRRKKTDLDIRPKRVRKKNVIKIESKKVAKKEKAKVAPKKVLKKAPRKAPDPSAKLKKFLAKTPNLRGRFNQLNDDDFGKIVNDLKKQGKEFSTETEFLAITMATKILDDRAAKA